MFTILPVRGANRASYVCKQGACKSKLHGFKTNIRPITDAIEKISKIRGVNYNWNNSSINDGLLDIGFIAQELQLVFPELVAGKEDSENVLVVKYDSLIAVCLEAIKQQSEILDYSEKKLEILEKRLGL